MEQSTREFILSEANMRDFGALAAEEGRGKQLAFTFLALWANDETHDSTLRTLVMNYLPLLTIRSEDKARLYQFLDDLFPDQVPRDSLSAGSKDKGIN